MHTATMRAAIALLGTVLGACAATGAGPAGSLESVLASAHRTPEFAARDRYRHPRETLEFFGLKPDMTVVEVWPGGGWYTEILGPYLHERGRYYAAGFALADPQAPEYRKRINSRFAEKLAARPELYGRVRQTELGGPDQWEACPPGTADLVLTFRNVHNWMSDDNEREMFRAFHAALKPGGVLGVVEHRASPGTSVEQMKRSGYVTEDYVIQVAEETGFRLVAKSEVNANPADTRDHPRGVWTLPPSLALQDEDREKYLAIGESDRMTLKFVKPMLWAPAQN